MIKFHIVSTNLDNWIIDDVFQLNAPPDSSLKPEIPDYWGEIYLQGKFTIKSDKDVGPLPPLKINLQDVLDAEKQIIKGKIHFRVTHCKNLKNMDVGGASDPYVKIHFPNKKPKVYYETKLDNLNPVWDKNPMVEELSLEKNVT